MIVKELIAKLQKCNPNDIVMYNVENSFTNSNYERGNELQKYYDCEFDVSVDAVYIGSGTLKGFVFLTEELLKE